MTIKQRIDDFREHTPAIVHENHNLMAWLEAQGFFTAPASTKYHGNYAGGLYDHSKAVALALQELTDKLDLQWQRPESPLIVGWFHDLCKIDQYVGTSGQDDEARYAYNETTPLKGHGEKSVMYLAQFMPLTFEEIMCIRYHMGAFYSAEMSDYSRAVEQVPNVLFAHTADMIASKIQGV